MQESNYSRHQRYSWSDIDASIHASIQTSSPCYTMDLLNTFDKLDFERFESMYSHDRLDADKWFDISRTTSKSAPDCVVYTIDDSFTNYSELLGIMIGVLQEFDAWYDASYSGDEGDVRLLESIIHIHDTILGNDLTGLYQEMDLEQDHQDHLDAHHSMCMIGS